MGRLPLASIILFLVSQCIVSPAVAMGHLLASIIYFWSVSVLCLLFGMLCLLSSLISLLYGLLSFIVSLIVYQLVCLMVTELLVILQLSVSFAP